MIATLNGTVAEKLAELVVIDVNGVGYGLLVNAEDYGRLNVGEQAKLYVFEYIRENSHDLFGFISKSTMSLFVQLLTVNGVGPRMALNMLSIGSADEVREAIASGDTKFIQSANGVGKKVAERVVVDLKDKLGLADTSNPQVLFGSSSTASKDDAVQALVALGYSVPDAVNALSRIDDKLKLEDRVKQALKEIN